jgi:glutaredoxin
VESSHALRPRCGRHGLATGPDGRCTLCKRSISPDPPVIAPMPVPHEPELDGQGAHWLPAALGLFGLVLAAALAAYLLGGDAALASLDEDAAPVTQAAPPRATPPRGIAQPQQPPPPAPRPADPVAAAPTPTPPPPVQGPAQLAPQRTPQQIAEEAEQDRKRSAMIEADRERRKLMHARGGVLVVMYSTSWCPACKAAREYMTSHQIPYVDNDIEESESANAILKRLNPRGSIPTIDVDGEVMVGFSPEHIEAMLERAARKRAGI